MRAKNREINIFNMSLLDILTGMLGAFLFLMLGLLPYYAKVSKNKDMNPEELRQLKEENKNLRDQVELQKKQIADLQKQLDDLQKLVKTAAGGPMTAEQIQQLLDQMTQLRQQLQAAQDKAQQMEAEKNHLQDQITQEQQQLDQTNKEKNFWKAQQGTVAVLSSWDSSNTDIDVLAMGPDGSVYSPKIKDKFMGKDCIYDGDDSHAGTTKYNHEGLLVYMPKSGDYLIFYHVPQNAVPADYINLHAYILYSEVIGVDKGGVIMEDSLGNSKAALARPGGYYAWSTITYDAEKRTVRPRPTTGKLPNGIEYPQFPQTPPPPPPAPGFPSPSPSPSTLSHAPHL